MPARDATDDLIIDEVEQEEKTASGKKEGFVKKIKAIFKPFSLGGYFSYAFTYASWEVIRARKVGTTHTKVDYVVYRVFYPIALVGYLLFWVVDENTDVIKFLYSFGAWAMIVHVTYAILFLKNVLENNLYRVNVKHRQKIPERLVVTDEIEKGGHKFYICKRYSILPTESLSTTEKIIYLLFNSVVTNGVANFVRHQLNIVKHVSTVALSAHNAIRNRAFFYAVAAFAEVIFTPIPMRLAHVIYPVIFYGSHFFFIYQLYLTQGIVLYKPLNYEDEATPVWKNIAVRMSVTVIVHFILTGVSVLRDYIISHLDDSKTTEQIQSLRAQKRLARRKIMNYIEGPDGRVIGISLEKHSYVPTMDEVIQTKRKSVLNALDSDAKSGDHSSSEEEDGGETDDSDDETESSSADSGGGHDLKKGKGRGGGGGGDKAIKPPPPKRYQNIYLKEFRFSSSSSDEDVKKKKALSALSEIKFPSVPRDARKSSVRSIKERKSKIPIPIPTKTKTKTKGKKPGLQRKIRDSKENILQRLEDHTDSPPTPPFIKLVQTMIKIQKSSKKEVEVEEQNRLQEEQKRLEKHRQHEEMKRLIKQIQNDPGVVIESKILPENYAHIKLIRAADEARRKKIEEDKSIDAWARKQMIRRIHKDGLDDDYDDKPPLEKKPRGSKVIDIRKIGKEKEKKHHEEEKRHDSNKQSKKKIQKLDGEKRKKDKAEEKSKRPPDTNPVAQTAPPVSDDAIATGAVGDSNAQAEMKKDKYRRGILKDEERRPSVDKRREEKIIRRREERIFEGKQGRAAYDPISVPTADIPQKTTFHYLGAKLQKAENNEKKALDPEAVVFFKKHPGFATVDKEDDKTKAQDSKSIVAFHPVVRYFDVNEVQHQKKHEPQTDKDKDKNTGKDVGKSDKKKQ